MSYRSGIGQGLQSLGFMPREPHIVCDDCGAIHMVASKTRIAPTWLMDGRSPPKWTGEDRGTSRRKDYCPSCSSKKPRARKKQRKVKS